MGRIAFLDFSAHRRSLPILFGVVVLAAILIGNAVDRQEADAAPLHLSQQSGLKIAQATQGRTDNLILPPGAAALVPVGPAADMARAINASTPFAAGGTAAALPFLAPAGTADYLRAADCLAAAGFYEAGTRPEDQRAVMQVVLNRVRHNAFPHSVCGVVFQGSHLRTGCQFTFTCDGAMLRRQPSQAAWRQAQAVAGEMLSGRTDPTVGRATHYHTNWVHPVWSGQMEKIAAVDTHLFFRWPGRAGNLQAFGVRYAGAEPPITQLAGMSFAHRVEQPSPASPAPAPPAGLALSTSPFPQIDNRLTAAREPMPDIARAPDADVILIALDAGADPDSFLRMAETRCAGKATCRFLGWTDPARKASQLPISGAAIDAMSFSYIRQAPGDPGKARWNCSEFARADRAQCLRRGT
ncbi:MAG: cell wall hydrolase [Novosphingobium sp.]